MNRLTLIPVLSLAGSVTFSLAFPAQAQPANIHWDAKPRVFTSAEYEALVACTLEKHPDTTKRYATYHLQRRSAQTWQENERDPDSELLMPSLEGCMEFRNGEQFPFSLNALILRWAAAHSISRQVP